MTLDSLEGRRFASVYKDRRRRHQFRKKGLVVAHGLSSSDGRKTGGKASSLCQPRINGDRFVQPDKQRPSAFSPDHLAARNTRMGTVTPLRVTGPMSW